MVAPPAKRHFVTHVRNGRTHVICGKDSSTLSRFSDKPEDITCKFCLAKISKLKEFSENKLQQKTGTSGNV